MNTHILTSNNTVFYSINPVDNTVLETHSIEDWKSVANKLSEGQAAFVDWKKLLYTERAVLFRQMAVVLRKNKETYAHQITLEMGKPIVQSRAEVEKCAWVCEYYAENIEDFLTTQTIEAAYQESYVQYQPLGIILQVMPWNFPFWQVFRFAAPALMAGNVTLLKHAPNVLGCVRLIQDCFEKAGFPQGVFQTINVDVETVPRIIEDKRVQGVALTGSVGAGSAVGALAGKAIKNVVLELGGSDAFIVLEGADLEQAAKVAVQSRMHNSGQTCISAKRIIVEASIAKAFKQLLKDNIAALKVGNPMDETTNISVMARPDLVEGLERQVQLSVEKGAVIEVEGGRVAGTNYFHPMLLSNIEKGMPAYEEELFGPVMSFFEVENADEAVALANDSEFGLAGTVWSKDLEKAKAVASQLDVGAVAINRLMSSDPRIPFGGVKKSGVGRELGREGVLSFVNLKSIVVG